MAILPLCPGLTAEILISYSPAIEHPDPDDIKLVHEDPAVRDYQAARTVSTYIESVTGQPFSIRMSVGMPAGHVGMGHAKLSMDVEVDGIPVWTMICPRPWFKHQEKGAVWSDEVNGPKEGKGRGCVERRFAFAKIETGELFFFL